MANNIDVKDAASATQTVKTTDNAGVHTPHHNVDSSALPSGASTSANQSTIITALAAIQTAVETLDNIVSGSEAQVDIISSALPSGASTATNQSTIITALASIQTALVSLATAANQSTANTALAAIQAAVEIIDNVVSGSEAQVDVVSSALPTGAATASNQSTANTALAAIQTAVEIIDNAISGSEMQVDVLTLPALAAGTNAIGKLAANSGVDIGDVDVASIAAGENHLGEVGGSSTEVTVNPTVSTSPAYSSGDNIGGKQTLSNALRVSGGTAMLVGIMLLDRSNQKPTGQIFIFNADPTSATLTDNTATAFSTDDQKVIAMIQIASSDWVTVNGKAYCNLRNLGILVKATSGTTLYAAFNTTSTPTFAATTNLQIKYKFLRD